MNTDERDEGEEHRSYYEFVETKIVKSSTNTEVVYPEKCDQRIDNSGIAEVASSSSSSSLKPAALQLHSLHPIETGVKHYGRRMRLYCRTGFCITILPDGNVTSDSEGNNATGILEFSSAGLGEVRIRGVEANLYLAMNKKGNLYGEEDPRDFATVFVEGTIGPYNTYLSQKYAHLGWYVGIKKNGTIKKGPLTRWGQKAIQFLPIRV